MVNHLCIYIFTLGDDERGIINNALYQLMQAVPCLRFGVWDKGQSPSGDYVHVFKGTDGCWSHVGRQGGGQVYVIYFFNSWTHVKSQTFS